MSAFKRLRQSWSGTDHELRVLSASGQLGFGIPQESFVRGLKRKPHVIAADMGSVDPGPVYLGSGKIAAPEALVRSDLRLVLRAALALDVPLLIGSAGTAGANAHLDRVLDILREIAREDALSFQLGVLRSEVSKGDVGAALTGGRLRPIGALDLDADGLSQTGAIVGQAGMEPFRRALEGGADVIVAGRACDTAPFAVVPAMLGYPIGPAIHMSKILECTSLCCDPGGRDAMLATLQGDGFILESMNLGACRNARVGRRPRALRTSRSFCDTRTRRRRASGRRTICRGGRPPRKSDGCTLAARQAAVGQN